MVVIDGRDSGHGVEDDTNVSDVSNDGEENDESDDDVCNCTHFQLNAKVINVPALYRHRDVPASLKEGYRARNVVHTLLLSSAN